MKNRRIFVADFETTVDEDTTVQENSFVWASGLCEICTENAMIFGDIDSTYDYLKELNENVVVYYHNLKFDGNFILWHFLVKKKFKQAFNKDDNKWLRTSEMPKNSIKYSISSMGQWYTIIIKFDKYYVEIKDSLKLLPFSLKRIGESFKTKHKKLEMEYKGFRYPNCYITEEEKEYLKNDLFVIKEAIEFMFQEGHSKLTIGSCCLDEYKKTLPGKDYYDMLYPNLFEMEFFNTDFTSVGQFIRKAYRGGWCYLVKEKSNKIIKNGVTADVNSLYPSVMHSISGNYYPVGEPLFFEGKHNEEWDVREKFFYYIKIKCRFYLKEGMLPTVQIKNDFRYKSNEWLFSSDVYDKNGELVDSPVVDLYLSCVDYQLFIEHYNIFDLEEIYGVVFQTGIGMFDSYIDKWAEVKKNNKGAMREEAKLFLNNLYGKMSSSTDSDFKIAYIDKNDNGKPILNFDIIEANDKRPGYIAVGAAITSYAREFTIRAAQQNYHGPQEPGFIYADTDSIHCDLYVDEVTGIKIHDKDFCCWKLESFWNEAIFVRQKTYIEHVFASNQVKCDHVYDIKCAGMPEKCKQLFRDSMNCTKPEELTEEEKQFVERKRTMRDFKRGLQVPGKLRPKRVVGGVLLVETPFTMK